MSTAFKDIEGFPHADTTIAELEQIASEPEGGFGRSVRGAYFACCLRELGSLTVYFPKDRPNLLRRFNEAEEEDRRRLLPALLNVLADIGLEDIVDRIFIK